MSWFPRGRMKLNLGCGSQIVDGWVNADKFGTPDQVFDLESFPWPWPDSSADEILLGHVRPITAATMEMFSRSANLELQRLGAANTPLALHHDVDFEIVSSRSELDEPYRAMYREGRIGVEELHKLERTLNNVALEIEMVLKAKKPARSA